MGFIVILILTTLAIAGTAAFFSIYGLAAIFSGIFWPVVTMGTSLEAGKLVAVSYIYRYRDSISQAMKWYLILAILVLMLITSAGIFGFLSMGYQQDALPLKQQEQQILLLETERNELQTFKRERLVRRKQIDADIASLPNNYIKGRERLIAANAAEYDRLRNDIQLYTRQISEKTIKISELKQKKLINEVHTGPIIFIAKAFSTETDDATKWMIILIMFAFDPLAVALTLGVNHAIRERKKEFGHVEHEHKIVEYTLSDDDTLDEPIAPIKSERPADVPATNKTEPVGNIPNPTLKEWQIAELVEEGLTKQRTVHEKVTKQPSNTEQINFNKQK